MKKKYISIICAAVLFTGILAAAMCIYAAGKRMAGHDPLQPEIAQKILRFHILANSDGEKDQSIKLKVRDEIGNLMQKKLKDSEGLPDTEAVVLEHMDEITETAERILRENGCSYGASAKLAKVDFPEKTYGEYTFPEGEYEALQVTLGEGGGHNWWCVLYPNMCFQGSVYEVVEEEADEKLQEVLTPAEYADVFNSGKIRIRLKFLEYFR